MNRAFASLALLLPLIGCSTSASVERATPTPDASTASVADAAPPGQDVATPPADGGDPTDATATSAPDAAPSDAAVADTGLDLSDAAVADAGLDLSDAAVADTGLDLSDAAVADAGLDLPDAAPVALEVADGGAVSFDVVSSERCEHRSGHLLGCVLPPITIQDPTVVAAGALRKTTLSQQFTGDCSSAYPLQLNVSATDLPTVIFHLSDGTMDVRRLDRGAIDVLTLADDSSFHSAAYVDTCHLWVTVQMNEADAP